MLMTIYIFFRTLFPFALYRNFVVLYNKINWLYVFAKRKNLEIIFQNCDETKILLEKINLLSKIYTVKYS